ncbi:MAG: hypothetical protein Q9167_007612 [Letrouitia subvulpina]
MRGLAWTTGNGKAEPSTNGSDDNDLRCASLHITQRILPPPVVVYWVSIPQTRLLYQAFDVNVIPKLITVPGRVLAAPDVKYAGTQTLKPRFGSWNMQSVQFVTKAELTKWSYLRISLQGVRSPWQSDTDFHQKLDSFQTVLKNLGIRMTDYMICHECPAPTDSDSGDRAGTRKTPVYNRVKSTCDIKEGILNVCVLDLKFSRANDQHFANVGLKFNLKLGSRNHALDLTRIGILRKKKTMVVGIDVTHPSPGSSSSAPSVAGVVASVDEWLNQWPADLRIQTARQEMVDSLDILFKSHLRLWEKRNGSLPENIIIYRDGVSEDQYDVVLKDELPALRKGCEDIYPATMSKAGKPRMTIAIVGKRHNTRFYPTRKEEADRSWNPQNGTVVDRGVTEARNWDFFLQAHTAIQGTARPAHYYLVYDQIFRQQQVKAPFQSAADAFEDLTHNLCYLFGRRTKAVSRCPPAYYADLVCDKARCYLSGIFAPSAGTSPSASIAPTSTGGGSAQVPDSNLVKIHQNVRDAMFYV